MNERLDTRQRVSGVRRANGVRKDDDDTKGFWNYKSSIIQYLWRWEEPTRPPPRHSTLLQRVVNTHTHGCLLYRRRDVALSE
ncbi:hypothetical protein CHS0354_040558, partial [Potamilus streckersoni]